MTDVYDKWRDRLLAALDPRFYDEAWLDSYGNGCWLEPDAIGGKVALFSSELSAALVEILEYTTGFRELRFVAACGDCDDLVSEIYPKVEQFAVEQKCGTIRIQSRDAWAKIMEPLGFYRYQQILEKEL